MVTTPPGLYRTDGAKLRHSTTTLIAARARWQATATAWLWHRRACHAEALALLDAAGIEFPSLRLRAAFALDLSATVIELLRGRGVHGWRIAARGLSQLALGDTGAAQADLAKAMAGPADLGLWLRAATSLSILDPDHVRRALEPRREAPARLLLAHLAVQAGDADRAERLSAGLARTAEVDLLAANIAILRGHSAGQAIARVFARTDAPAAGVPRVSIVVAAHDAERTIDAALESLTAQSWRDLEILVIDDASSDATASRAEAIAAQDPRVRVLRQALNRGAYAARNAGIAAASGDFIAFHDADDVAHPERIARQAAPLLEDKDLAFTTARWVRRDANGLFRCRQVAPLVRLHVGSMLIRRGFLEAVGPFDPVRFGADNDLLLRLKVAAGAGRHKALSAPLTIGGFDPRSAVHDPATGYGARGFSRARQEYREARTLRLIAELRQGMS
jgi:hypothetical protein